MRYNYFVCKAVNTFWKCDFEKSAFKVFYSFSKGRFFLGKSLKISQKLNGSERKHKKKHIAIWKKKRKKYKQTLKLSKMTDEWFFTIWKLKNCPYLKIGMCDLLPVLLECITYLTMCVRVEMNSKDTMFHELVGELNSKCIFYQVNIFQLYVNLRHLVFALYHFYFNSWKWLNKVRPSCICLLAFQ